MSSEVSPSRILDEDGVSYTHEEPVPTGACSETSVSDSNLAPVEATTEQDATSSCSDDVLSIQSDGEDLPPERKSVFFDGSSLQEHAHTEVEAESVESAAKEENPEEKQPEVPERYLGLRMKKAGQVFFFREDHLIVRIGSKVIVVLETGPALAEVESILVGSFSKQQELEGKVTGYATAQDIALHAENSILAAEAEAFCKTCIRQRNLDMKLVDVEVLHDRSKIIFYFTAPSRIDFRELVKDLVRNYRTRIELRQIGVRHETQMLGGLGNCGMVCCCHRYLRKFAPVTIKMAKEQNLFLNPAKLSGMCGRLLCCLSFEQGNYEEFNRRCPKMGKKYQTSDKGVVKILRANMFSQSIAVLTDTGEELELSLEEWEAMTPRRAEASPSEPNRAVRQEDGGRKMKGREHGRRPEGGFSKKTEEAEDGGYPDSGTQEGRFKNPKRGTKQRKGPGGTKPQ